jgi:dTDP-4-amino-4,6-dideoxygalactose transaminase
VIDPARKNTSNIEATASFPGWPHFDEDEIAAVERVLRSGRVNYWTGNEGRSFEKEFAEVLGAPHTICLANGTVALELALAVLGIGPGDEVETSPRTFIASASCVVMRGAKPVFADVDRYSQNITAATIERVLTPTTKAIIPVHLAGWPCEMDELVELARAKNLAIVEDCAQANGALYRGRPVGTFGDAGAFSFCQDKIITTGGEGGMLVTADEELWRSAWSYKDHGKSYDAMRRTDHPPGFRWVHESFGTNWRMTEMQAAIGRIQLRKLDKWVERRRVNAEQLRAGLTEVPALRVPEPPAHIRHAYYRFYAFLDTSRLKSGWSRTRVVGEIASRGVPCFEGSCSEVYLERVFDGASSRPVERLPVARELGDTAMAFLVHPTLSASFIERIRDVTYEVVTGALR